MAYNTGMSTRRTPPANWPQASQSLRRVPGAQGRPAQSFMGAPTTAGQVRTTPMQYGEGATGGGGADRVRPLGRPTWQGQQGQPQDQPQGQGRPLQYGQIPGAAPAVGGPDPMASLYRRGGGDTTSIQGVPATSGAEPNPTGTGDTPTALAWTGTETPPRPKMYGAGWDEWLGNAADEYLKIHAYPTGQTTYTPQQWAKQQLLTQFSPAWIAEDSARTTGGQEHLWELETLDKTQGWQSGESAAERAARLAELTQTQGWQSGESAAERAARLAEQMAGQTWQSGESAAERAARLAEQQGQQTWQSGESAAERAARIAELERTQGFVAGESAAERAARMAELERSQAWGSTESAAERAARMAELNTNNEARINELMRTQGFTREEAERQRNFEREQESTRFGRGQQVQGQQQQYIGDIMGRLGIGGGAPIGSASTTNAAMRSLEGAVPGAPVYSQGTSSTVVPGTGVDTTQLDAQEKAGEDAAFARAKDRIGQMNRANLNDLGETMNARGIGGSGIEGALTAQTLNEGAGQLGAVAQDQAIEALRRRQQLMDRNLAANVTTRGQNVGLVQSLASLMRGGSAGAY